MIPRFSINLNIIELFKVIFRNETVEKFEKNFSSYFKLKYPISFSYGRSAIYCFLKSMKIVNKDIIMPSYTCSVIAHAIKKSGNNPKFLDVNKKNFNFNNKDLAKNIDKKTACIILTNTFGIAQDVIEVKKIIKKNEKKYKTKIFLIQDCCHSFDAKFKNKTIIDQGDMVLFSFNISKTITSIFGSIATFEDKEIFQNVKNYRDKNFRKKKISEVISRFIYIFLATIFFNRKFYFFTHYLQKKTRILKNLTDNYHLDNKVLLPPDYNTMLCDLEAKVGNYQLNKYKSIRKIKLNNSKYYSNILKKNKQVKIVKFNSGNTYSHFPVLVKNKKKVIDEFEKFGYEIGEVIQYSIPNLKPYKTNKKFLNSDYLSNHMINLPNEVRIPKKFLKIL